MKTASKKTFRDYDGYDVGAGRVKIRYAPIVDAPFGNQYWGITSYGDWEHVVPSDWQDVPTVETLFHEMIEFPILRGDLKALIEDKVREALCSGVGSFLAEVAKRNPEFWKSLSLKGD